MTNPAFIRLMDRYLAGTIARSEQDVLWKLAREEGFQYVGDTADLEHEDGRFLSYRNISN